MVTQAPIVPGTAEAPAVNPETAVAVAVAPSGAPESSGLPRDVDMMVEEFLAATDPAKQQEAPAPEPVPEVEVESNADVDAGHAPDPEKPLAKNWRVTAKSEAEAKALEMYRRNPDLTLAECLSRVTGSPSPAAEPSAADVPKTETPVPPEPSVAPAVAELEAQIEAKKAERKKLREEFDLERADEVSDEMDALKDRLRDVREQEKQKEKEQVTSKQSAAQQEFAQQVEAAEARTIELYPDAAVEGSELWNAMIDIQNRLNEAGDTDTLNAPDVALRIARMAARELNVAPAGKNQRPAAQDPEPANAPNPVKPRPVPGRGAAPSASAPQIDLKRLTLDQLEELQARI